MKLEPKITAQKHGPPKHDPVSDQPWGDDDEHKDDLAAIMMKHELLSSILGFMIKSSEDALSRSDFPVEERTMAEHAISQLSLTRKHMDEMFTLLVAFGQATKSAQQIIAEHAEP